MHFSLLAAPLLTAFLLLLRVLPCFVAETLPAPLLSLPLCYLPWWPLPRESLPPLSPSRLFPLVLCTVHGHPHRTQSLESSSSSSLILNLYLYSPHLNTKRQKPRNGSLSVQTSPNMDDCATGSFCSSCAIPPRVAGGLWSDGVGCDACCYPFGVLCRGCG